MRREGIRGGVGFEPSRTAMEEEKWDIICSANFGMDHVKRLSLLSRYFGEYFGTFNETLGKTGKLLCEWLEGP
jgi:hypothetical protein